MIQAQGNERTCKVVREARGVAEARRFAELAVAYCDAACREATVMVVTELAENIVKYAEKTQGIFAGTISVSMDPGRIRIRASNEVSNESARNVKDAVAQIAAAPEVRELYRTRLAQLFANPELPRAQLGLLRAAFEGGFKLSCTYDQRLLTIVAERVCERQ